MLLSAAASDQGFVRGNNEDRVYSDDSRGIYVVVDGMGGHAAGEQAAEIAVERIRNRLERLTDSTEQRVREAITLANNAIFEAARTRPEWLGMACVLTVAVVEDALLTIGHVGDSRLYKVKRGSIEKITRDHSPVGEREDAGELGEADAMAHPRRNEVFRDVGSRERTPDEAGFIDVQTSSFEADSALLLCSDGLSDVVPSARVLEIVEENAGDRWATVRRLVDAANEASKDNVSVVLVEGPRFADSFGKRALISAGETTGRLAAVPAETRGGAWRGTLLVLAGAVLGALAGMFGEGMHDAASAPRVLVVTAPARIAEALDRAKAGDTVQIGPGLYSENIRVKDGVNLVAQVAREVRIEGAVSAENVRASRIEGLSVHAPAVGIDLLDSAIEVKDCEVTGASEAGIRYRGASGGRLIASDVRDNGGAGIQVGGTSAPVIEHNAITGNGKTQGTLRPGLWIVAPAKPVAFGNVFAGNGAEAMWIPRGLEGAAAKNFFTPAARELSPAPFRVVEEPAP